MLLYLSTPGCIALLRGLKSFNVNFSPVEYTRRYADEPEGTVDLTGTFPCIECELELLSGDPAHDMMLGLIKSGATGDAAAVELYAVDASSGSSPFPCVRREYAFVPKSLRSLDGTAGMPAYALTCAFKARGLPQRGSAVISPDGQTLTFFAEPAE